MYFVPGLAASKEIFRNIRLSEERYEIHILEWLLPKKKETLGAYAQRMAQRVKHRNIVLVGVSFGGVMAQEMSSFLDLKSLVIISSVKSKNELPLRLRLAKKVGAYKLLPTGWALSVKDLTKLAVGPRSKRRLLLYQEYLSVRDKQYLDWAIKQMVCWERAEANPVVHHIHGDQDSVFPLKYIKGARVIEGGNHAMILRKGSVVSKLLERIVEED